MNLYLRTYNALQLLGWISLLIRALFSAPSNFYLNPSIELHVKFVQVLMALEVIFKQIFHSLIKISPAPIVPSTVQIASRIWAVYCMMDFVKSSQWVYSAVLMWSIAECIRYGNYLYSDFIGANKVITWFRYSGFIVLYPLGISSELLGLYDAYPVIQKCCPRVLSFEMPNELNFSFDYLYFIWLVVVPAYIVGSPFMYTYMLGQRRKKLV